MIPIDPDTTLQELRELLKRAEVALAAELDSAAAQVLSEFVEKFYALDYWLSHEGFSPKSWARSARHPEAPNA